MGDPAAVEVGLRLECRIYFNRSAEFGSEVISTTDDPGRLGRSAYTYFHLPMVAGVIATVARPSSSA